jgi:tRNA-splicing ligase RtcB (3'-phosphate/5'-hydroxy nucleic acid ligase)
MSTETLASIALPQVTRPGRVPIKSWVIDIEGGALEQATNLSNLPFAIGHVAPMPDAHAGYGMPIGGVLFADKAVVPYAIGVDIGCGVALVETDLTVETLGPDGLNAVLAQLARNVPVGNAGQPKAVNREAALAEIGTELPASVERGWFERSVNQLGTLGSGNHFLEANGASSATVFGSPECSATPREAISA